jgi:hypothetical protein
MDYQAIAATLTAGLLAKDGTSQYGRNASSPPLQAARMFFDCLEALHAEEKNRKNSAAAPNRSGVAPDERTQ